MKHIKYIIYTALIFLLVSVSHATNTWQENLNIGRYQFTETIVDNNIYRADLTWVFDVFLDTTFNLDNTFFGRAQKIENVDITAQIRSAWSQGYTGQGINIGILDYFGFPGTFYAVSLNNVTTNNILRTNISNRYVITSYQSGNTYTGEFTRTPISRRILNDGNFNGYMSHGGLGFAIAGGRLVDVDGTYMVDIAKDATMHLLEAKNNRGTTFSAQRLDFINASLSRLAPSTVMSQAYQAMDTSGIYPDGHLPVYISSAGNNQGHSASYTGITQGAPRIVNYFNAEMALSTETFDDRPFSDYLLVAGGVVRTSDTAYRAVGNMPGEVTELQNRWLVAPFTFELDNRSIHGTSYAAPFITGIAGIVNSKFPEMAPADVATLLLNTARDLGATGTDAVYGRGMVDLNNALSPQ